MLLCVCYYVIAGLCGVNYWKTIWPPTWVSVVIWPGNYYKWCSRKTIQQMSFLPQKIQPILEIQCGIELNSKYTFVGQSQWRSLDGSFLSWWYFSKDCCLMTSQCWYTIWYPPNGGDILCPSIVNYFTPIVICWDNPLFVCWHNTHCYALVFSVLLISSIPQF